MSSSGSNSYNAGSDQDFVKMGEMAYQFEPEFTEQDSTILKTHAKREIENTRKGNTTWCLCSKCISMPLLSECLCCHEFKLFEDHLDTSPCVTDNADFQTVCLNNGGIIPV